MSKNLNRRKFCKHSSLVILASLFPNFAYSNSSSNKIIKGKVLVNGKNFNQDSNLNLEDVAVIETNNTLALLKNDQNGFLIRPNTKIKFFKNKIRELVKGSVHGIFGKQSNELKIKTPRGTIGVRGTAAYIEYEQKFDRTYVCNCYGETAVYDLNNKELKVLSNKYHTPLVINNNNRIDNSPYNYPLNHFDDNINSIENFLGRKPKWELPEGKMIFFAPDKEKIII